MGKLHRTANKLHCQMMATTARAALLRKKGPKVLSLAGAGRFGKGFLSSRRQRVRSREIAALTGRLRPA
jgi:hypothetical protein